MKTNISRKRFISASAMSMAGIAVSGFPLLARTGSDAIRIGIIGVGSRGLGLLHTIKDIPGFRITACCDIVENHVSSGMKLAAAGAKAYSDYRKLLDDKAVDAVIIATPLYLHYPMAADALKAGKHVYLEKTMTYNIDQAVNLVKQVKQNKKLKLQIGHQYRHYEMYPRIKTLIQNKLIGTVTHFESQYNRNSDWRQPVNSAANEKEINWRLYREFSGGVLAELSAHQIDIVNWILDSHPLKVVAMGDVNFWKDGRTTNDNVRAIYEYPNGVKSSVTSILSNEYNGYLMRILGSEGTIELRRDNATLFMEPKKKELAIVDGVTGATKEALLSGKGISIYKDRDGIEPTVFALRDFADCIKNNTDPVSNVYTGKDVAIAVHLGNMAVESGMTEQWKPEYNTGD